jgi:chromosome segregation ATPase
MLEQRLLLEEAQAALHRQAPEQQVQASIQQARNDLQQFFQQLHSDLKAEQQRLDQRIQELNEQQQMFRRDREDLERWFAEREQQIAASQPEAINSEYETRLAALQDEVVSVRKRWNADRTEAESTIRDLLDRLTAADARAFQTEPSLSDLTEMDPGLSPEDADSDLPNGADSPHTDAA